MGVQLIFVVEASKKCKSDWIYIKETVDRFYTYNHAHVKLSPVYMDGKSKYKNKEKEVKKLIKQYDAASPNNKSIVIYCFDCDDYDKVREDLDFLNKVKEFCGKQNYEFVWFCKDIESVYIGRKVPNTQKKKEAESFKAKRLINRIDENALSVVNYRLNSSNLLKVLDKDMFPLVRK